MAAPVKDVWHILSCFLFKERIEYTTQEPHGPIGAWHLTMPNLIAQDPHFACDGQNFGVNMNPRENGTCS